MVERFGLCAGFQAIMVKALLKPIGGGIKCCVVFNPTCEDTMVHKQSRHVSNVPKRAGS